jgi:monofunctional biosynthetic peptidoglycan transglycosylase
MSSSALFDFSSPMPDDSDAWRSIDDPVMGGVSESSFVAGNDGAVFEGTVSLDRGGGFASVRSPEGPHDMGDHDGLHLRLRGDGQRYWFTAYTEEGGPISYRAPLRPPEHWSTLAVPFDRLTPYRRGSTVPDAPPFSPGRVRALGFLIADEQAGPFRLEVAWIRPGLPGSS